MFDMLEKKMDIIREIPKEKLSTQQYNKIKNAIREHKDELMRKKGKIKQDASLVYSIQKNLKIINEKAIPPQRMKQTDTPTSIHDQILDANDCLDKLITRRSLLADHIRLITQTTPKMAYVTLDSELQEANEEIKILRDQERYYLTKRKELLEIIDIRKKLTKIQESTEQTSHSRQTYIQQIKIIHANINMLMENSILNEKDLLDTKSLLPTEGEIERLEELVSQEAEMSRKLQYLKKLTDRDPSNSKYHRIVLNHHLREYQEEKRKTLRQTETNQTPTNQINVDSKLEQEVITQTTAQIYELCALQVNQEARNLGHFPNKDALLRAKLSMQEELGHLPDPNDTPPSEQTANKKTKLHRLYEYTQATIEQIAIIEEITRAATRLHESTMSRSREQDGNFTVNHPNRVRKRKHYKHVPLPAPILTLNKATEEIYQELTVHSKAWYSINITPAMETIKQTKYKLYKCLNPDMRTKLLSTTDDPQTNSTQPPPKEANPTLTWGSDMTYHEETTKQLNGILNKINNLLQNTDRPAEDQPTSLLQPELSPQSPKKSNPTGQ